MANALVGYVHSTVQDYLRSLLRFITFAVMKDDFHFWKDDTSTESKDFHMDEMARTVQEYMLECWDLGVSPNAGSHLLQILTIWLSCLGITGFSAALDCSRITLKRWQRTWQKKGRKPKHPVPEGAVRRLANQPPHGIDPILWKIYVLGGWSFLLRHAEVRQLRPDLVRRSRVLTEQGTEEWWWCLTIPDPKTGRGLEGGQDARLLERVLPPGMVEALRAFQKHAVRDLGKEWCLGNELSSSKALLYLRKGLSVPIEEKEAVTFHSLRHGRATNLYSTHLFNMSMLKEAGRWRSESSARIYLHKFENEHVRWNPINSEEVARTDKLSNV
jgi:hypothetical protein